MARGAYKDTEALRSLRELVAFAEGPTVSPLQLARSAKSFVSGPGRTAIRELTPQQIEQLQSDVRAFLRFAGGGDADGEGFRTFGKLAVEILPARSATAMVMLVDGAPREALLYQVAMLLSTIGLERLRLCPAPDCGKAFVKTGRREYCSDRCQRRVFVSTYDPFQAKPRRKEKGSVKTTRAR